MTDTNVKNDFAEETIIIMEDNVENQDQDRTEASIGSKEQGQTVDKNMY